MATPYYSLTFLAKCEALRNDWRSLDDVTELLELASQTHDLLIGSSRSGWAFYDAVQVCIVLELPILQRLMRGYSVFPVELLGDAMEEIDVILRVAAEDPHRIWAKLDGNWGTEDLARGLRDSAAIEPPDMDAGYSDEGFGPVFFFTWLKSLRALFQRGLDSNRCVVNAQPTYQLG